MTGWLFSPASAAFLASALIAILAAAMLWRRRTMPGATELLWAVWLAAWWAVLAGLELAVVGRDAKILLSQLTYLGAASVGPLYLLFALKFAYPGRRVPLAIRASCIALPVVGIALAFTNQWHGTVWTAFEEDAARNLLIYHHGPGFYFVVVYSYVAILAGTILLINTAAQGPTRMSGQALVVVLAALLPLGANVLYVLGMSPMPGVDLGPAAFSVTAILFAVGVYRLGLFRVVPIARELVLDQMADGMIVLDPAGTIADTNGTALRLLQDIAPLRVGEPAPAPLLTALRGEAPGEPHGVLVSLGLREIEVRTSAVADARGERLGSLLLLRDVTKRVLAERALADARQALADRVHELEATLAHVKTLEGLLPICAYCKSIRNDQDSWQEVESYIGAQTGVKFTHSICPSCARKVLTEFDDAPPPR